MIALALWVGCSGDDAENVTREPPPPVTDLGLPVETGDSGLDPQGDPSSRRDILLVLDQSPSMIDEFTAIAGEVEAIEASLGDIDYHIGVVSMDTDTADIRGRLQGSGTPRYLSPATDDLPTALTELLVATPDLSFFERGVGSAYLVLYEMPDAPENVGFRREDAPLHIVFMSDEPDQTDPVVVEDMYARLRSESLVRVHAYVPQPYGSFVATYQEMSTEFGGIAYDVSDADPAGFIAEVMGAVTN